MMPTGGPVLTGKETFMAGCDGDDMMFAPGVSDGEVFAVTSSGFGVSPARGVGSELTFVTGPHLRCPQYAPSSESVAMHPGGDGPPPQVLVGPVHPELASSLGGIGAAPSHRNLMLTGLRSLSLPSEVRTHPMERHCQPAGGAVSESSKSKIRRPPNAFMIFANEHRKILARAFPNENNQLISVRLGCMWKSMAPDYKGIYYKMAQDAAARHKRLYPSYVYSPKEARIRKQARDQVRKDKIPKFVFYVAGTDEFGEEDGSGASRPAGRAEPSTETRAKLLEVAQLLDSLSSNDKVQQKSQPLAAEGTANEGAATQQSVLEDKRLRESLPSSQCQLKTFHVGPRHEFYDVKHGQLSDPQERVGRCQIGAAGRAPDKDPGLLQTFTYDERAGSTLMYQQEVEPSHVTAHHSFSYLSQRDLSPALHFHVSPQSPGSIELLGCEQRFPPQPGMPVLEEEPTPQPQPTMHAVPAALPWKERPLAVPLLQSRAPTMQGSTAERWVAHSCPGHNTPTSHTQTSRHRAHQPLSSNLLNATTHNKPEASTFSELLSYVQSVPERAVSCSAAGQCSVYQSVRTQEPRLQDQLSHRPQLHGGWSAQTGVLHNYHPRRGDSAASNSGHLHAPMVYGDSHGRAPCVERLPQRPAIRPAVPAGDAAQQAAGSSPWAAGAPVTRRGAAAACRGPPSGRSAAAAPSAPGPEAVSAALLEDQICPALNSLPRAVATFPYEPLHVPRYTAPAWCEPPGGCQEGRQQQQQVPMAAVSAERWLAASPQPRQPLTVPSVLSRSDWIGDMGRAPTPPCYSRASAGVLWPSPVAYLRASCSPNIEDLISSPDNESPTL